MPISVNRSNFASVFLRLVAMLILVQEENDQDQAHKSQDKYSESG